MISRHSETRLHLSEVFFILFYASEVDLEFNPKSIFSSYRTFYFKSAEQMAPHIFIGG